ncbi:hypothetical protein M3612_25235 [Niallia taxi]|uniref:hypothetical protein n=1 Tax=Niallia taxi TaxID=2499688 RepID=UPI00203A90DC|nr:hypothetical protein [Niallia taxi]MCM3217778.1 hypothetical protein [Niallia taxi]
MIVIVSCSLLAILATAVCQWYCGTKMFEESNPFHQLKYLIGLIMSGIIILGFLSIYVLIAEINDNSSVSENLKWIFFLGIILISVVPLIIIYKFKEERFIFDTLKPIVNGIAVISTIFLFLIKTFGHIQHEIGDFSFNALANDIGFVIVQYLPFLIYPYSIAFTLGEYFVKYNQLIKDKEQKKQKQEEKQKKQEHKKREKQKQGKSKQGQHVK